MVKYWSQNIDVKSYLQCRFKMKPYLNFWMTCKFSVQATWKLPFTYIRRFFYVYYSFLPKLFGFLAVDLAPRRIPRPSQTALIQLVLGMGHCATLVDLSLTKDSDSTMFAIYLCIHLYIQSTSHWRTQCCKTAPKCLDS